MLKKARGRYQALLQQYGRAAVGTYLAIFALVLGGFVVAIEAGYAPQSAAGTTGTWAAAYVATKLTQPLRIGVTCVLTPIVARFVPPGSR